MILNSLTEKDTARLEYIAEGVGILFGAQASLPAPRNRQDVRDPKKEYYDKYYTGRDRR
jgi:hypothetical protein